jgi:HlyD family secretion protein
MARATRPAGNTSTHPSKARDTVAQHGVRVTSESASIPHEGALPAVPPPDEVKKNLGFGRKRRHWVRWVVLALALAGVVLAVRAVRRGAQPGGLRFKEAAVTRADLRVTVSATGTLKAQSTVEAGAEVSGRVLRVLVEPNDRVRVGDLLAEIDPEPSRSGIDEANARVAASRAAVRQAEATRKETELAKERAAKLVALGVLSEKEKEAADATHDRAVATQASAAAELGLAEAQRKNAGTKLARTRIVSPIDGVVLTRLIEPGQTVTAGFQTPVLFKLAEDLSKMRLFVYVDEADVGRVAEGQEASFTVDAHPGKTFPSKLLSLRFEPRTEQNVVSYEAVLAVENDKLLLRPGMTANATITADKKLGVLTVPNQALRFIPPKEVFPTAPGKPVPELPHTEGPHVWVLENGLPKPVSVQPGATDGERTEVLGLDEGTKVIADVEDTQ